MVNYAFIQESENKDNTQGPDLEELKKTQDKCDLICKNFKTSTHTKKSKQTFLKQLRINLNNVSSAEFGCLHI